MVRSKSRYAEQDRVGMRRNVEREVVAMWLTAFEPQNIRYLRLRSIGLNRRASWA